MTGWYRMKRGWAQHAFFKNEPYSRRDAWVWLIDHAAWKTIQRRDPHGALVVVERGQLQTSIRTLADIWQWSRSRVERFISDLKTSHMIGHQTSHAGMLITICNYEKYQTEESEGEPSKKPSAKPQTSHPQGHTRRIQENINNKHPTKETPREAEKPRTPISPKSEPSPSPRFVAAIKAANMTSFPSDLGKMLDEWDRDGIDFDGDVLLAIRDAEQRNRENGGKPPFRFRFFDQAVRAKHDESQREIAGWLRISQQAKNDPDHPPHPEELVAAGKFKAEAA